MSCFSQVLYLSVQESPGVVNLSRLSPSFDVPGSGTATFQSSSTTLPARAPCSLTVQGMYD